MSDLISRKGVFIPDITVEMFRNASLESIEDLMASGEMEDILLPPAQPDIDKQELTRMITAGIIATNTKDVYSCGMRNGMRWCRGLLEEDAPKFEDASLYAQPETHDKRTETHSCDLISRQAALDVVEREQFKGDAISEIEKLPSAKPERKNGKWSDHQEGDWIYAKCSLCGAVQDSRSNFCPNCGAEMEGEGESK